MIQNLDYSGCLRDLETGLGFFGYYRKFVPYYSAIAQPLLDLKTTGFKTSPPKGQVQIKYVEQIKYLKDGTFPADCKAVWDKLKELLCNAPILAFPDFLKDFIIYIDSSKECSYGRLLLGPSWSGSDCSLSSTPTKILKLKVIITSQNFI